MKTRGAGRNWKRAGLSQLLPSVGVHAQDACNTLIHLNVKVRGDNGRRTGRPTQQICSAVPKLPCQEVIVSMLCDILHSHFSLSFCRSASLSLFPWLALFLSLSPPVRFTRHWLMKWFNIIYTNRVGAISVIFNKDKSQAGLSIYTHTLHTTPCVKAHVSLTAAACASGSVKK